MLWRLDFRLNELQITRLLLEEYGYHNIVTYDKPLIVSYSSLLIHGRPPLCMFSMAFCWTAGEMSGSLTTQICRLSTIGSKTVQQFLATIQRAVFQPHEITSDEVVQDIGSL